MEAFVFRFQHRFYSYNTFALNRCGCIVRLLIPFFCLQLACCFISSGRTVFGILSRLEYQPLQLVGGRSNVSLSLFSLSICFALDLSTKLIGSYLYYCDLRTIQKRSWLMPTELYSHRYLMVACIIDISFFFWRWQIKSHQNTPFTNSMPKMLRFI